MIISASRRTDIPAFHSEWFMEKMRAGFCCITNPFNPKQVSRVSLALQDVDVIVFWTKNPKPIFEHLDELESRGYKFYFQFTLNDYPSVLEPHLPSLDIRLETFKALSDRIGCDKVIWRYDPIVISRLTPIGYHSEHFNRLAQALSGYATRVVISIVDEYKHARNRLNNLDIGYVEATNDTPGMVVMLRSIASSAGTEGMEIFSCAEAWDLEPYGISPGKCIDDTYIRRVFGTETTSDKDKNQRAECGCVKSRDIGTYNTCLHG